ncbi:MAG: 3-ketoacyl-ACP reductase [Betaproteobacteria bacterium AqS2]|uniref:3-ketoacyl-ACP reductase n=1 Tax=Candidatus Amphirhobacter heronislandensis TaxID=1732024 RepID=A0A930UE93_9GAMM|nr:3-ketoacyl-ACP reductase [Betaproteobacteria bacterium AqS2]
MGGAAVVTGSARGIGRAIALQLAEDGYDVVVNGSKPSDALDETAELVRAKGRAAATVAADVGDLGSHEALLAAAAEFGGLACLVNNAGVSVLSRGDMLDASPESYDRCMAINVRGAFFLTQRAAKAMLAAKPDSDGHRSIIWVTSINATALSINRGEYCVSKAAASMAARLYALRLADSGIGCYEIQPGIIKTDMTAPSQEKYDRLIAEGLVPQKRWGEGEDIARAASAIAAGRLSFAVGQSLQLDGGLAVARF